MIKLFLSTSKGREHTPVKGRHYKIVRKRLVGDNLSIVNNAPWIVCDNTEDSSPEKEVVLQTMVEVHAANINSNNSQHFPALLEMASSGGDDIKEAPVMNRSSDESGSHGDKDSRQTLAELWKELEQAESEVDLLEEEQLKKRIAKVKKRSERLRRSLEEESEGEPKSVTKKKKKALKRKSAG